MITHFDHPHVGSITEVTARVGGKGASLCAMTTQLGLPVPPGFTIGTEHAATGLTDDLFDAVLVGLDRVGAQLDRRFGDDTNPLLVSVRSGAPVSMPGMMDTILNVGITRSNRPVLGPSAFVDATYAAFREQFTRTVPTFDSTLMDDPHAVLRAAIAAVFASWNSARAQTYRTRQEIAHDLGTAVTIQAMVFGNCDARSGTGVAFSRDPSTGAPGACGDWLPQAQGEAVVAGTHTTQPLSTLAAFDHDSHTLLLAALDQLEVHYRDMVDVEFTIETGQLWILQARPGKRTAAAAARIACDLAAHPEIALSRAEAVARISTAMLDGDGLRRQVDGSISIARGLGVSPGLVTGRAALDCDYALELADTGESVILVRSETSPEDVHGMGVSAGILTATGGAMSHAALVAREWGIAAVCGADIAIDTHGFMAGKTQIAVGEIISIDGTTGEVFAGAVASATQDDSYVETLRQWASEIKVGETVHG
jgi:pyruvate, orthophosphate dikinase